MTLLYDLINNPGFIKRRMYWNFSEWHPETAYTWHESDAVGGGISLETNFTPLDGVLYITKTTNLPPANYKYQPALYAQQRSTDAMIGYYRYCEVFDK